MGWGRLGENMTNITNIHRQQLQLYGGFLLNEGDDLGRGVDHIRFRG